MRTPRLFSALALALTFVACGDEDPELKDTGINTDGGPGADAGDSGTNNNDGGNNDGGNNDGGTTDTGTLDTGVQGACDPITGNGCIAADNFCVLQPMQDVGMCRLLIPAPPKVFEATCAPATDSCAAGLACIGFVGEVAGPTCKKVCSQANGMGCEGLVGTSTIGYDCAISLQGATNYAFCVGRPRGCNPLNNTCPVDQRCDVTNPQGRTGCLATNGTTALNMTCAGPGSCARDALCVNFGMGANCREPCMMGGPACSTPNYMCQGVMIGGQTLPFGLCVPM